MSLEVEQRFVILFARRIGKDPVAALVEDIAFLVAFVGPIAPYGCKLRTGFESTRVDHAQGIEGQAQQIGARSRSLREFRSSGKLQADYGPSHAAIMFDGQNPANKG